MESGPDNLHMHFFVSDGGNGSDRLDHVADHVENGQVDDGPVGNKLGLFTFTSRQILSASGHKTVRA